MTSGSVVVESGNVGIGTKDPRGAKLVVSGKADRDVIGDGDLNAGQRNKDNPVGLGSLLRRPCPILSGPIIVSGATEFNAFSDQRIKNIQGPSDGAADLRTLLGIEVTDYRYKDVITNGGDPHKKVIAQQVEQVFPEAVDTHSEVVPDIYQQASVTDGRVSLATDLKRGERVRLIADEVDGVYEVLEVTADKFRPDFEPVGDRVFVYGREVGDFRTVDYDAIAMLSVSALQQLKREKDEEVQALRAENAVLRRVNDELAKRIERLEQRMGSVLNLTQTVTSGAR